MENTLTNYWIIPPDVYKVLDDEFHFNFDPCPYPRRIDGLRCDWGKMSFVNPPFRRKDGSPTAFVRKAIEQQQLGNSSVLTLPTQSYVNLLLESGAECRSLGRIKWLSTDTLQPMKSPSPITMFYLRGKP